MLHSSLLVYHFIAVTILVVYTSEGGAASVEVYCNNSTSIECSIGFTWLNSTDAIERCITQGFGDSCRLRARMDYFTTVDEVLPPYRHDTHKSLLISRALKKVFLTIVWKVVNFNMLILLS